MITPVHYINLTTGTNDWAKTSLQLHAGDKREYIYSKEQLEQSKTHDDLWNAAQVRQLGTRGSTSTVWNSLSNQRHIMTCGMLHR